MIFLKSSHKPQGVNQPMKPDPVIDLTNETQVLIKTLKLRETIL